MSQMAECMTETDPKVCGAGANLTQEPHYGEADMHMDRDNSGYGFSQHEGVLLCNASSHWPSHCVVICMLDDEALWHYSDVIMSTMASQTIVVWLFAQSFVQAHTQETSK